MDPKEQLSKQQKAVLYIRMSTDHQKYSPDNQKAFLLEYANKNGLTVVGEFIDEGISGVVTQKRYQFLNLIDLVRSGKADFGHILVYDASRWGRFIDPQESSYYQYLCQQQNIILHKCAEPIPVATEELDPVVTGIIDVFQQTSAGLFSKGLSKKVFLGQENLIRLGFRQGGSAGYGLRRLLVDENRQPKFELKAGEHKSIQTDRVILVPGPEHEQAVIRKIYEDFVYQKMSEQAIADDLNRQHILTDRGTSWTRGVVHQILINEKYIGNNVWNKSSYSPFKPHKGKNASEQWVRANSVFQPIVSTVLFNAAQSIIHQRSRHWSNEEMLDKLKELLRINGKLSGLIIDEAADCPSSSMFRSRFGSLLKSYQEVGYTPSRDYRYLKINRALRRTHADLVEQTIAEIERLGGAVSRIPENDLLHINQEFFVSLVLARCRITDAGTKRWFIRFDSSLAPDLTIAVRLDETAEKIVDYYLLPSEKTHCAKVRLTEQNPIDWDCYHHKDLSRFFAMSKRVLIKEAIL